MLLHETESARGGAPIEQLIADCPDDWREKIFAPHRPVIPWLRIKDFKLVTLKMIVSSMLLHQSRQIKKKPELQALEKDIAADPAEYDEARVSHTGKRGFASALGRLRLTTASRHSFSSSGAAASTCEQSSSGASSSEIHDHWIDGVFVPGHTTTDMPTDSTRRLASQSSRSPPPSQLPSPRLSRTNSDEPSLLTLGANLYVSGELTQQQLGFSTSTTLIVSGDNPGAEDLVQETPDLSLGSNPNPNPNPSPNPSPSPNSDRVTSRGRRFSVSTPTCAPSQPTGSSSNRRLEPLPSARACGARWRGRSKYSRPPAVLVLVLGRVELESSRTPAPAKRTLFKPR